MARSTAYMILILVIILVIVSGRPATQDTRHFPPSGRTVLEQSETFEVYPADTTRYGGLGLLQRRWMEAMFTYPETDTHPLNGLNPYCLRYPYAGVRMLTGDFNFNSTYPDKTCDVKLDEDMFLSVYNIPGSFIPPTDKNVGYPANPTAAEILLNATFSLDCRQKFALNIDGVDVNVTSYYSTTTPGLFRSAIGQSYLTVTGYPDQPQQAAPAFGGGTFVLFRFKTTGPHTIIYGVGSNCTWDLDAPTAPFNWVYTNDQGIRNHPACPDCPYNTTGQVWGAYGPAYRHGVQTRPAFNWTMHVTVT